MQSTMNEKILGTNCYNCKYISSKIDQVFQEDLNESGGIDPKNDSEMRRAEAADLITLPGGSRNDVAEKRQCRHPKVNMPVTARMCCSYWDNDRVIRPWLKQ